jgi:hypothetical protein
MARRDAAARTGKASSSAPSTARGQSTRAIAAAGRSRIPGVALAMTQRPGHGREGQEARGGGAMEPAREDEVSRGHHEQRAAHARP